MVPLWSNLQSIAAQQLNVLWQQVDQYVLQPLSQNDNLLPYAVTFGVLGPLSYIIYKNIIYNLYLHPLNRLPGPPLSWDNMFLLGNIREISAAEVIVNLRTSRQVIICLVDRFLDYAFRRVPVKWSGQKNTVALFGTMDCSMNPECWCRIQNF
jgi:hypothetical protein